MNGKLLSRSFFSTLCFVLLFSREILVAQNEPLITLESVDHAIALALENNPDLNVYLLQQEKAKADYRINRNYILPTISGSLNLQNNLALPTTTLPGEVFGQAGDPVNIQLGQQYNYNAGINLTMALLDREGSVKKKISGIGVEIAEAQTELFRQTLKEQAAFYYYSVLVSKQAVQISTEDHKISDSIHNLTESKFKQGLIDLTTLNQAEINKNNVYQNLLGNQNINRQSLENLKLLLGIATESELILAEDVLAETDTKGTVIDALNPDKNLEVVSLQKEQSELGVKQGRASFLPKLSLNGYFGQQQLKNVVGISFEENSWNDYSFLTLNASIPIISGFTKKNNLKIAKLDNEIAKQNLLTQQKESKVKDNQLLEEYGRNRLILENSQDSYRLSKENAQLALKKFDQGLLSLDTYFKNYEDYLKAENSFLNTLSMTYGQYATLLSRQ